MDEKMDGWVDRWVDGWNPLISYPGCMVGGNTGQKKEVGLTPHRAADVSLWEFF